MCRRKSCVHVCSTRLKAGIAPSAPPDLPAPPIHAGFARQYGDVLFALEGDAGARAIIESNIALARMIEVSDAGIFADIDVVGDLK
jgi:CTP:molybdopterin cytidylyltransferase MocA